MAHDDDSAPVGQLLAPWTLPLLSRKTRSGDAGADWKRPAFVDRRRDHLDQRANMGAFQQEVVDLPSVFDGRNEEVRAFPLQR
jgi:hypothetical protein